MSRSCQKTAQSGFLLVEALTAMAIGALLLVALGSLISLVTRAADRTAAAAQATEETSRVFSALRDRIETITPQRWAGAADAGFVFEGSETSMMFARMAAPGDARPGSRLVLLTRDQTGLREQDVPLPPDAQSPEDALRHVAPDVGAGGSLVQPPFDVRFAYYQRLANGTEVLTDRWSAPQLLPVAIRVTVTDREGQERGSLRIALRVDAEPGCASPEQGRCSLAPAKDGSPASPPRPEPIDPDDARGWERYRRP